MKRTIIVIGAFLCLVVLGAGAFTLWAAEPVEMLLDRALKEAEKKTGRHIEVGKFGGNPFLGFRVRDLVVKARAGGGDTLRMDSLKFSVSLPMLMQKKVVFKEIEFVKPVVSLERYADGKNSFSDILESLQPAEEKEEKPQLVFFRRIELSDMTMALKLHREDGAPVNLIVKPVNLVLEPAESDSYDNFKVKMFGKLEGMELTGEGTLQIVPEFILKLDWKTNRFDTGKLPDFLSVYFRKMEIVGLKASAELEGSLMMTKDRRISESKMILKDVEALGQKFGGGLMTVQYGGETVKFFGKVGKEGPEIVLDGIIDTREKPRIDSTMRFGRIDVTPAVRMLLKDKGPDIISGKLSGEIRAGGPWQDVKNLDTRGTLVVRKGSLNYPTPALNASGSGRAPINFEKIEMALNHRQPRIDVRDARMIAHGISATARGTVSYLMDKDSGKYGGPVSFNLKINAESRDIEELLKVNKYTGPAVSGVLKADGAIRGNTSDMNSLAGVITFALADGSIVNPYFDRASSLPVNVNLSNFDFDSIRGTLNISNGIVTTQSIRLLSSLINADVRGSIGFDGAVNGHAEAMVEPSVLASIADFQAVLPRLNEVLKDLDRVETSFELSGTVQKPVIHWNAGEFARKAGKKIIEKKAGKAVDKLLDRLDEKSGGEGSGDAADSVRKKVKDKLKGLF